MRDVAYDAPGLPVDERSGSASSVCACALVRSKSRALWLLRTTREGEPLSVGLLLVVVPGALLESLHKGMPAKHHKKRES